MDIPTLDEVLGYAQKLVPAAREAYPDCEVWLTGSYARGYARPASDINVAVITDDRPAFERTAQLYLAAAEVDDRISVNVCSSSGFEAADARRGGLEVAGGAHLLDHRHDVVDGLETLGPDALAALERVAGSVEVGDGWEADANGATRLRDERDVVSGLDAEVFANGLWDGDLALGCDLGELELLGHARLLSL